jgi:murein DD-endopeptidase MepM/ murein hydrolase activator NlpD
MSTPNEIFQSKGLWQWWLQNSGNGTNVYDGINEKGIDFSNPFGTPIGAVQGGQVVVREHHNNSIGDLVVVQGTDGYWLYQHITSNLQVGDSIATGGVVGTENGLPVDQFSTGPHIEVRFSPTYNTNIDSWLQPWINPKQVFSSVSNAQDNSGVPFTTSTAGSTRATLVNNNNLLGDTTTASPFSNVIGGFDFSRFIDAFLLLIVAVTLLVIGGLLIAGKFVEDNAGTITKVAEIAA